MMMVVDIDCLARSIMRCLMRDGFDRDMIKSGEDEKGETAWNVRYYIFMRIRTRISVVSGQAGSQATGLLKYAWQRIETYQQ